MPLILFIPNYDFKTVFYHCFLYLYPIIELFFLFQIIIFYGYIFWKLNSQRRLVINGLSPKLSNASRQQSSIKNFKAPIIIVSGYVSFILVPNLYAVTLVASGQSKNLLSLVPYLRIFSGLNSSMNALVYILLTPVIRRNAEMSLKYL